MKIQDVTIDVLKTLGFEHNTEDNYCELYIPRNHQTYLRDSDETVIVYFNDNKVGLIYYSYSEDDPYNDNDYVESEQMDIDNSTEWDDIIDFLHNDCEVVNKSIIDVFQTMIELK